MARNIGSGFKRWWYERIVIRRRPHRDVDASPIDLVPDFISVRRRISRCCIRPSSLPEASRDGFAPYETAVPTEGRLT